MSALQCLSLDEIHGLAIGLTALVAAMHLESLPATMLFEDEEPDAPV